jgi:hypothetical protein
VRRSSLDWRRLVGLAREIEGTGIDNAGESYATLNAIAARLYGLTRDQYEHVLSTFPLLPLALRNGCLSRFTQGEGVDRLKGRET